MLLCYGLKQIILFLLLNLLLLLIPVLFLLLFGNLLRNLLHFLFLLSIQLHLLYNLMLFKIHLIHRPRHIQSRLTHFLRHLHTLLQRRLKVFLLRIQQLTIKDLLPRYTILLLKCQHPPDQVFQLFVAQGGRELYVFFIDCGD